MSATICYTDSNKKNLSVRYTTQMPNIRGFGPLMALIFCPTMHVRCNNENTHYTALRTGLGYDNDMNRPFFHEHDMVFNLNVEITQYDIELVYNSFTIFVNIHSYFQYLVSTGESNSILHGHVAVDISGTR